MLLRHLPCIALLAACSSAPALARPLEPELANCLVWQVDNTYVHGQTFQLIGKWGQPSTTSIGFTDESWPTFLEEKWRNPSATSIVPISCVISGSRYSLVAPRLREYLAAEVRSAVLASVRVEMAEFLRAVRDANTEERKRMIEALLNQLPSNQGLIDALKKAVEQP